jgi:alpha-tubulin suppressor-like RCC1 family protein
MTFLTNNSPLETRYFSTSLFSTNNDLWSFGNNSFGQLGTNNQTNYSSPVQVGALSTWSSISCGQLTTAGIINGTLWIWGNNSSGQLGLGDTINRSSPTQVGLLSTWTQISLGFTNSLAVQNNGTLWAWGTGFLGLNTSTSYSSPVQVGNSNNWISVACTVNASAGIQNNSTLWTWGSNGNGELGINTSTGSVQSPIQVGILSTWASVTVGSNYMLALQTNGTLWSWGSNDIGQLGLNTTTSPFSSPVQVGTLSTWIQVIAGSLSVLAIQNNGTLWAWGNNSWGQLGTGNQTNYSSPVQVGRLTNWSSIKISTINSSAIQNNGTLWTWGNNSYGQLGTGNQTNYSSPVQVGTLNNWNFVTCGDQYTVSLQQP